MTGLSIPSGLTGGFLERWSVGTARQAAGAGALIGLATGAYARIWMRTITEQEPKFTVVGTLLILLVFAGMGAWAGLGWAWWRRGSARRTIVRRGVAAAPVLLLGPFVLLFVPSLVAAGLLSRRTRRFVRWPLIALAIVVGGVLVLGLGAKGSPLNHLTASTLYLALSYEFFLVARILFARGNG